MNIVNQSLKPLADHNAKIMFWATLFGRINFLEPVLILFYLHRGLEAGHIFVLLLCFSISVLIFEVPTGAFADRFGPKASFMVGTFFSVLSKVILIFAYEPILFYVSKVLDGMAASFFSGSDEALIYESLKETNQEERMSKVWGRIESATFIPMIVSFAVGGFIAKDLQEWQFMTLIGLGIVFSLARFMVLTRVITPKSFEEYRDNPFKHVANGVRVIRHQPQLVLLFLNFTVALIPTFVFQNFDQPYLTEAGLSVEWLGLVYAGAAVLSLTWSRNIHWFEKWMSRPMILMSTGLLTATALFVAGAFLDNLMLAVVVFAIVRTGNAIRYPVYSQMTNDYIPSQSRATTISLLSMMDSILDVVIFSTLSFTAGFGLTVIFVASGIIIMIGSLIPVKEKLVQGAAAEGKV